MSDFLPDIEKCLEVLKQGGTILYPTDTVWGLGCDATNAKAVEKIFRLKQRPENRKVIVLLAEERDLLKFISAPDPRLFEYLRTINKPTTVIYRDAIGFADNVIGPDGSVAVRVVQDAFCRHLIKRFRRPIVSTSANLSGDVAPGHFKEISAHIRAGADYVVQYRQDDTSTSQPSSIIKWNADGTVTIIRP